MTIILFFATMKCQHMHLSRKSNTSHLQRARGDRQKAVFAVCLRIDRDINELMQLGSILTSLSSVSQQGGKSQKQIRSSKKKDYICT